MSSDDEEEEKANSIAIVFYDSQRNFKLVMGLEFGMCVKQKNLIYLHDTKIRKDQRVITIIVIMTKAVTMTTTAKSNKILFHIAIQRYGNFSFDWKK